jgi:hypothetical protein
MGKILIRKLLCRKHFGACWELLGSLDGGECQSIPIEKTRIFWPQKAEPTVSATAYLRLRQTLALPIYTLSLILDFASAALGRLAALWSPPTGRDSHLHAMAPRQKKRGATQYRKVHPL